MNTEHQVAFAAYAHSEAPKEAVALLIKADDREQLICVPNTHPHPNDDFLLHPRHWINQPLLSIVHSHSTGRCNPSSADRLMCEEFGVPWHIYSVEYRDWNLLTPIGYRAPLAGREFIWGVHDCFALARDYYREKLGLVFDNYFRPYEFWTTGEDLITPLLEQTEFRRIKDSPRLHDLVVMQLNSRVPNHLGVLRQNNLILHHINRRVSGVSIYGGLWLKSTVGIYRHKSLW